MTRFQKIILLLLVGAFCSAGMYAASYWTLEGTVLSPRDSSWSVSMTATRVEKTSDAVLTADECRGTVITNQGASSEVDLTLYAMTSGARVTIVVEAAQVIEVGPPSGEAFDLDGTTLDADDCIDSPAVVGSKLVCTRIKNAAGTAIWSCDTVRGAWVDTGASD